MMVVVIEITAAIDDVGTLQTFLFSSAGWTTLPTDTPPNAWIQPRMQQAANYRRELFSGNRTFGAVQSAYGECKLINTDGALDEFSRHGFDGQDFVMRIGEFGAAYPSAFTTVLKATMKCALCDDAAVRLVLRDRLVMLDKPLATELFAGDGAKGDSAGAAGIRRSKSYGTNFSCAPQLINDVLLIYSVGAPRAGGGLKPGYVTDGASFVQYDREYATLAQLRDAAVAPGYWAFCSSAGVFKIGTKPTYELAVSVIESSPMGDVVSVSRPGTILAAMAMDAGMLASQISAADVIAVDAARAGQYGYHIVDEETALSAMSKIAASASLWFAIDALGILRMGTFSSPVGPPVYEFTQHNVTGVKRLDSEETAVPVWRVTARSSFNGLVQSTFAETMPLWFREYFKKEWPYETQASNESIKRKHRNAGELSVDVYSGNGGGVRAGDHGEAQRRLMLFGVERDLVQVTTPITPDFLLAVDLGKDVMLRYPRYSWAGGKLMVVVALTVNNDTRRAEVTLWG